ncbi:MAG: tRNA (uridine(34)/cytosine(34)/5-carboxymethylaminomethyluridine(34)-2'-O)-methyltransferase TrmL [Acutalibacteraceae bacterium]|nr:tRNA (uridine(34)/cytosine(34)/5-carboxymethylaminomethyluridine(34)-2'-O)-methyltransferase TrmL [Acutalibacteraceae bacterium]
MPILNVVLVEPEIPSNTGNIVRTCAATGARLHIIKPMGFTPDDKKLKRAGLDYWKYMDITYYENLDDFFSKTDCNNAQYYYFTTKGRQTHSEVKYNDNCYLMFGKETAGLPEELLIKNPERCVRLPMMGEIRSLNLSNTVCVGVYEVLRQWDYPLLQNFGELHKYKWSEV